jgi:hypothetical protein
MEFVLIFITGPSWAKLGRTADPRLAGSILEIRDEFSYYSPFNTKGGVFVWSSKPDLL